MTIRSCLVLAFIAAMVGVFIGRSALPNGTGAKAAPKLSPPPSAAPAARKCEAARAELASTKAQLAVCMVFGAPAPEIEPSGVPEESDTNRPEPESVDPRLPSAEDRQTYREFVDSDPGTILVQHFDGTLGVYNPDIWPIDGDGVIIARKLPDGKLGWYAGPDAGPRSDPSAFKPWEPEIPQITWGREPDGTITINGKPASRSVQIMFGGKVDEPEKPRQ